MEPVRNLFVTLQFRISYPLADYIRCLELEKIWGKLAIKGVNSLNTDKG
jgi:hypothetical protein